MALRTRVWTAGKLLVLTGALLATYFLFAAAAMRVAIRMREVTVPDLSARSVAEATTILAALGLTVTVEEVPRVDPKVSAGAIAAQDPPRGATTRRQRSVRVWLSAGPHATRVPRLVGEGERSAEARLQQAALALADRAEIRSRSYPTGAVVAQDPPPDSESPAVSLLVNRGERGATFVMPDLIGIDAVRAADVLRDRGFRVTVVGDHPYPGVPISLEVSR